MTRPETKLRLPARAPSEGARLLARFVLATHRGDVAKAARAAGISGDTLRRIVAGELVPGELLARPIGVRCGIGGRLWRRPAAGGWFDAAPAEVLAA